MGSEEANDMERELSATAIELLSALKVHCVPSIEPDEITAQDYVRAHGVSLSTAKRTLNRLVRLGELTSRLATLNGLRVMAYRSPEAV